MKKYTLTFYSLNVLLYICSDPVRLDKTEIIPICQRG